MRQRDHIHCLISPTLGHLRVISMAWQPEFFKVDIQFELQVIHLKYNDVINTLCTISNQLVEVA